MRRPHLERAALARLTGDEAARQRELREAHRLFLEIGAPIRAEQLLRLRVFDGVWVRTVDGHRLSWEGAIMAVMANGAQKGSSGLGSFWSWAHQRVFS
jgi:hypothetical protein